MFDYILSCFKGESKQKIKERLGYFSTYKAKMDATKASCFDSYETLFENHPPFEKLQTFFVLVKVLLVHEFLLED